MMNFRSNQNIRTDFKGGNIKVTSKQNRSTPGIVLKIPLHKNSIYRIKLNGYRASPNANIYLLISDINYRKIFDYENLLNMYNNIKVIEFKTGNFVKRNVLIYILFKNPEINDYFILDYFTIYDQYDNVVLDYNFNIQVYEDNSEELYNYFNDKRNKENNAMQNITKDLNIQNEEFVENVSTNEIKNGDENGEIYEEVEEIIEEIEETREIEEIEETEEKNEKTKDIEEIEKNGEIMKENEEEKNEEIKEIEKYEEKEIVKEKTVKEKRENKKNNSDREIVNKKSENQNSKKEKRGRKKKDDKRETDNEDILDQIIEEEIKKNLNKKDKDKKAKVIRYDGGHFYNDEDKNAKKEKRDGKKDEKKEEKRGKSKREIKKGEKDDKKKGESRRGRKKKDETNSENNLKKWVKFS